MQAVMNRKSGFERDSVHFEQIEYAWQPLAVLMWVAARCGGRLAVLDYGGSLGSSYVQHRAFLASLPHVRWSVVEQPRHVEAGKELFDDDRLSFHDSISASLAQSQPDVVLLSSVLQYLERPSEVLDQLLALPCQAVVIDRTPFWAGPKDRLCVQRVPPSIYPASYPSWILSSERFHSRVREPWRVMITYNNADRLPGPVEFAYQGIVLVRKTFLS